MTISHLWAVFFFFFCDKRTHKNEVATKPHKCSLPSKSLHLWKRMREKRMCVTHIHCCWENNRNIFGTFRQAIIKLIHRMLSSQMQPRASCSGFGSELGSGSGSSLGLARVRLSRISNHTLVLPRITFKGKQRLSKTSSKSSLSDENPEF